MSNFDAVAGMYNIVVSDQHTTAEYQIPVEEFLTGLSDRNLPNELSVVGLERAIENSDLRDRLVSTMREEMDRLNGQRPLPKIQFVVNGPVQGAGDSFDIEIEGDFFSLEPVFGRKIKQRKPGWLVTSFRV